MPASEARTRLAHADEALALVTHRDVEVGVVTSDDLAAGSDRTQTLADVMCRELVRIDPRTNLDRTLHAYTEAAWSSAMRRHPGRTTE